MIIEWIGCSGTGKSTLCNEVYKKLLLSDFRVRKPLEIFLGLSLSKFISNERCRNIILDILLLPWSAFAAVKYRHFLSYCFKTLNTNAFSCSLKIKLLRSILRKIGLHVFLNKFYNKKKLVLVDEGTVHIAHLLFANGDKESVSKNDIEIFCELVPTPDLIIQIMAPESEVEKRTLDRIHKPISETNPASLKRFIALGMEIFKILDELKPWKEKYISFFNPDNPSESQNEVALNITKHISKFFPPQN